MICFEGFDTLRYRATPASCISLELTKHQVIKALQDHKGTYLATPEWSEAPFSQHPKDIHDKLLDVLARGASFLGESDGLATVPPTHIVPALLSIHARLRDLEAQLDAVYAELKRTTPGPLFWSTTSPPVDNNHDAFSQPLHFPNPDTARLLTLYWAQQTLMRMGLAELRTGLATLAAAGMVRAHAKTVNAALARPCAPLLETAHLVLRARDYCSADASSLLRYAVPLNITLDVLANPLRYPREIAVAKAVKRRVSERHVRFTRYTGTLKHVKEV